MNETEQTKHTRRPLLAKQKGLGRQRSSSGQAIAEGAAILPLIILIGVVLIYFLLDVGMVLLTQQKLNAAASEAAKVVIGERYWLGMERPDYNQTSAHDRATKVCNDLIAKLGLPRAQVTVDEQPGAVSGTRVVTVRASYAGVPLLGGGRFFIPSAIPVAGLGTSVVDSGSFYAMGRLAYVRLKGDPNYYVLYVPIYAAEHVALNGPGSGFQVPIGTIPPPYTMMTVNGLTPQDRSDFQTIRIDSQGQEHRGGF